MTTGGAGEFRRSTQIQVAVWPNHSDPLAAKLRERLKSDFNVVKQQAAKLGVDCVFSTEALVYPAGGRLGVCNEKHGGRAKKDGLRLRIWRSHYGDHLFWHWRVSHALKKMMAKAERQA